MDIAALCISAISFLMSVILTVKDMIRSREFYSVEVLDYKQFPSGEAMLYIYVCNRSQEMLTISRFSISGVTCELEQKPLQIKGAIPRHTPDFPVCIPPKGCAYLYLDFPYRLDQQMLLNPNKALNLEIQSTRRTVSKSLSLKYQVQNLHQSSAR